MANRYTYVLPFTKEQLDIDYAAGLSQCEIAQRYGTTQKVVWKAMKNFGVKARVAAKRNQRGDDNDSWKGNEAGYAAMHKRIEALNGRPRKCEHCGTTDLRKSYDWANLTGRYEDPQDYRRLCRSCHFKMDKIILNIKHLRGRCQS
jgi:hypothetical protein